VELSVKFSLPMLWFKLPYDLWMNPIVLVVDMTTQERGCLVGLHNYFCVYFYMLYLSMQRGFQCILASPLTSEKYR